MGKLFVVATPIGNLSDISQRALDTLAAVDVIAAEDTRRTLRLLNHFGIKTKNRLISNYRHNEQGRGEEIIGKILDEDINVAIVSDAGTPCISDPGSTLVGLARANGIEVIAVPGASSVAAALSASGFSFDYFTFMGFIPRGNKEKKEYINVIMESLVETFVLFESPNRIISSLKEIATALPCCDLFVVNDLTKFYEKSFWGTVSYVIGELENFQNSNLGEYTIVLNKAKTTKEASSSGEETSISVEALLVDIMVKDGVTLKQAVEKIASEPAFEVGRNDAYKASLRLKNYF